MSTNDIDFSRALSATDRGYRDSIIAANDKFIALMARSVIKGKEKAVAGTFVDTTPPIHARRIRGEVPMSACGSPAAMCTDIGGAPSGAQTLR